MNKVLITSFFFPPEKGGIQTYTYKLASHLDPKNVVVLAKKNKNSKKFDKKQQFKIYRTSFDSKLKKIKLSNLSFFNTIKKIVKKEKIKHILLAHPLPLGLSAIGIKKFYNIPFSCFTHGTEILEAQNNPTQKKILINVFHHAKNVICTTEYMKKILTKEFKVNISKIHIIPPGIESEQDFKKTFPKKTNLLTVGRLVKRKGYDLVLQALANIIKEDQNISYTIVGNGPELKNIEDLITQLELKKYVHLKTKVPNKELKEIYKKSSIFIMPTRNINGDIEGFGIVYLEAAIHKLPIIASKSGGVPEAVANNTNGILIKEPSKNITKNDIQNLEKAIRELITNQDKLITFSNNGYQRAKQSFSWKKQAEKLKKTLA